MALVKIVTDMHRKRQGLQRQKCSVFFQDTETYRTLQGLKGKHKHDVKYRSKKEKKKGLVGNRDMKETLV